MISFEWAKPVATEPLFITTLKKTGTKHAWLLVISKTLGQQKEKTNFGNKRLY